MIFIDEWMKTKRVITSDLCCGEVVLVPDYYLEIGGMKGIALDLFDGFPDENDEIHKRCRVMLENGTFENIETQGMKKSNRVNRLFKKHLLLYTYSYLLITIRSLN